MREPTIPPAFQALIDPAVDAAHAGFPAPDSLSELANWFTDEGFDLLFRYDNEELAVNLNWLRLDDSQLADESDLAYEYILTDQMRLEFARARLSSIFALEIPSHDGLVNPSVITVPLSDTQGRSAILGYLVEFHGQAGPVPEWLGIYRDKEAFLHALNERNVWHAEQADQIGDTELLKLWDHDCRNAQQRALARLPQDERLQRVCEDIERTRKGGKSRYKTMPRVLLAGLLGVSNFEDDRDAWTRFDAMPRRQLDQLYADLDLDGEEVSSFLLDIAQQPSAYPLLPKPSERLVELAPRIASLRNRWEAVQIIGQAATEELEYLLNLNELHGQADNGIYGHAIWTQTCESGTAIRFQIDLTDLGEVDQLLGPYDDLAGKFADSPDHVVEFQ